MALTPRNALGEYGLVPMRAGGSSPTVTRHAFVKQDTTNNGVIDDGVNGNPCGISDRATTTADAYVGMYTDGVWKVLGTAGDTYEPGNFVYVKTNITVALDATTDDTTYPVGLVVGEAIVSGANYLYILFLAPGLKNPGKYQTS